MLISMVKGILGLVFVSNMVRMIMLIEVEIYNYFLIVVSPSRLSRGRFKKSFHKLYWYEETKNPIQVLHLRFQVNHNNPKKNQLFVKYGGATNNAKSFMI